MTTTTTKPKYDLERAIGFQFPDQEVSWNQRDLILYALSIGAGATDYHLLFDEHFRAFPTFPTVLSFKGTATDVVDFAKHFADEPNPPGLPDFDARKLGHVSQYIETIKPIPIVSGPGWIIKKKVVGIHESPKGVMLDVELTLFDPEGTLYTRLIAQARRMQNVANGTVFDKITYTRPQPPRPISELGPPTYTTRAQGWAMQHALYRLNGDYNPLHIHPALGEELGIGGVILSGLNMVSMTARAIVFKIGSNDPDSLKSIYANFNGALFPGDGLDINIWELGEGPAEHEGSTLIAFDAYAVNTGKHCLTEGVAVIMKGEVAP